MPLTLSQTTNFRPLQSEKSLQTTIISLMKMVESSPKEKKTNSPFPPVFSKYLYCIHVKTRERVKWDKSPIFYFGNKWKGVFLDFLNSVSLNTDTY